MIEYCTWFIVCKIYKQLLHPSVQLSKDNGKAVKKEHQKHLVCSEAGDSVFYHKSVATTNNYCQGTNVQTNDQSVPFQTCTKGLWKPRIEYDSSFHGLPFLIRKQKETCLLWFWELFFSCLLHKSKWLRIAKTMDRKASIKRTKRITRTPRKARARRMKRIIRRWLESTVLDSMVFVRRSCHKKTYLLLHSRPCSPRGNSTKTQIYWNRHHPHTAVQKGLNHRCGNDDQIKCIPPPLRSIKEVVEAKSHDLHDDFLSTNRVQPNEVSWKNTTQPLTHSSQVISRTCETCEPGDETSRHSLVSGFHLRKRMKGMDSKIDNASGPWKLKGQVRQTRQNSQNQQ